MFQKLEDGGVVLRLKGGLYKPSTLATYREHLFATVAGGYARLRVDGSTSRDGVSWIEITLTGTVYADPMHWLSLVTAAGHRALGNITEPLTWEDRKKLLLLSAAGS